MPQFQAQPLQPQVAPHDRGATAGWSLALAAALLLAACGESAQAPAAGAGAAPPPPPVGVVTVAPQAVALQTELPGRVEPLRTAQVRARVNGVVLKRQFTEGSEVRAGQALFLIDPAPYEAALQAADAQVARAEAAQAQARATLNRYQPLAAAQALSEGSALDRSATLDAFEAQLKAPRAEALTRLARLGFEALRGETETRR